MKAVEVMALLPSPAQPMAPLTCDEPLYQELVVLTALGFAEGAGERGETRHVYTGRLTEPGVARLEELRRRERLDG